MGTDALFENHTIKEIQEIEKKLRNDIEKKKEELRQMVGERYRDLMEAADTITEMKDIAESVTHHVKAIEEGCKTLQEGSLQKGILSTIQDKVNKERKQNELLYVVASQIKVLMDSPSKIWSSVENKDFLCAVSIFLLARHTHSLLMLDPVYQANRISLQFPIINRQWTSINNLKYVLLQNYQLVLEAQNIESKDVVGPLCCKCFLSNASLEEMFLDILSVRKNVIKGIFHPEKYAKDQMCEFVTVVQITLKVIYVLLFSDENKTKGCKTNVLYETLMHMVNKEESGPILLLDLNSTEIFKFLPTAVTEFRPSMKKPIVKCSTEFLQTKCNEWLNEIKEDFQSELVNLLNFVNSVKSIALIRKAVFENIRKMENWDGLCEDLLQQSFSVWDFFLKDCFLQRIKDILNDQVKSASEFCKKDIEETLYKICSESGISEFECERNISLYVWLESPCDVMDNISWIPRHQRSFWESGELSMKAMGFTPKVQNICIELNQKMQSALEDISTFSCSKIEIKNSILDNGDNPIFSSGVPRDDANIYSYLMEAAEKFIFELASYIETALLYLGKEHGGFENSCRIVFLGQLCYALMHLCPYINICLSPEKIHEMVQASRSQEMRITFHSNVLKESEAWKQLKNKLLTISNSAFKLWSEHHIDHLLKTVDSELLTCSAEGLLKALLRWDKIEIQEESEQGKAVKSVLRIPQHISLPLFNCLFAFCCKLNAVGGYAINSEVRSHISKQLITGLLDIYKEKVYPDSSPEEFNSRLLQVQSLQLLFDVQFLMGLTVHKDNSNNAFDQLSQDIINQAVSYIDPFDMDVFSVPLQQNLKKALQKSLTLFGLIASPDQVSYLNSVKGHSINTQMEHNVMLSSTVSGRFPLLPLSSRTSLNPSASQDQFMPPTKGTEVKTLQSHSSSPNLSESDTPTNSMKSTSFYDRVTAMSSSWFGS